MNSLQISGRIDDLFSHMALLGLGSILEDSGINSVRVWWNDEELPIIGFGGELSELQIAEILKTHASIKTSDSSWIAKTFVSVREAKPTPISLLGPRTATPKLPQDWPDLEQERESALDTLDQAIDQRLVQGLGYRSWWHRVGTNTRADTGANIWEMRTRNRGTEFLPDRLFPLAKIVSERSVGEIADGLVGRTSIDEHGNNATDSRTPTGFSLPRPVDNGLAWCALWALSLLPVPYRWNPATAYPAFLPKRSVNQDADRHQLLMPVPNSPLSLARMRMLLRSAELIQVADGRPSSSEIKQQTAWDWLQAHGAAAVVRFPVRYVGSSSAPERQSLSGIRVRP